MSKKLYIGNLSFNSTEEDLQALVSPYGTVESTTVIRDKMTSRSRGFGFVEMSSENEAKEAAEKLNGTEFQGRNLKIDLAREREPRSDRRPSSGGYGSRSNGGGYYDRE